MTNVNKRILIIDDDPVSREVLLEALEQEPYTLADATDGKAGLRLHIKNPFDLVITDIIMPEMEGLETIRKLKRISPAVKIIAISGGGHLDAEGYLQMAQKLGADRSLDKPIDQDRLKETIKELLA
jgi:CheY-like chemotaxis protein